LEWDRTGTPVQLVGTDRPQFTQYVTTNLNSTPTSSVPSFGIDTNGRVYSMGYNNYGNLASNSTANTNKSYLIRLPRGMFRRAGVSQSIRVVGGARNDGCWGLTPDGDCFVWGRMVRGNLGIGTGDQDVPIPICLTEPGIADNAIEDRKVQHIVMRVDGRSTYFLLDNGTLAACGQGTNWGGTLGLPAASDGSGTATGVYANSVVVNHPVLLDYTGANQINGSCSVYLNGSDRTSTGDQRVVAIYSAGDMANQYTIAITDGGERTGTANDWARGDYPRAYGWGYNASGGPATGLANRVNTGDASTISNWSIPTACKFYALQDLGKADESTALFETPANWLEVEQYSEQYFAKYGTNCKIDQVFPAPCTSNTVQFTIWLMSNGKAFACGRVNENSIGFQWAMDNVTQGSQFETNYTSAGYFFGGVPFRFQPARFKDMAWCGAASMATTSSASSQAVFMGYNNIPYLVSSGSSSVNNRYQPTMGWFPVNGNTSGAAAANTAMYLTAFIPGSLK